MTPEAFDQLATQAGLQRTLNGRLRCPLCARPVVVDCGRSGSVRLVSVSGCHSPSAILGAVADRARRIAAGDDLQPLPQPPEAVYLDTGGGEPESYLDDQGDARASTWTRPADVTDLLDQLAAGELAQPSPEVGRIADAGALFYRGRVNGIAGESGAGKTWTALHASAQELTAGARVVYIDLEDDAASIVTRLLTLGVEPAAISNGLTYLHPDSRPTGADLDQLATIVTDLQPSLVVIDSTGEGLAVEGANPNADDEVSRWFKRIPDRLARLRYGDNSGPAVVVLDHMSKADDGQLWPIGSQRKRAAITGAQYVQRLTRPFDQGTAGAASLVCAKDRLGAYRKGAHVATLQATPAGDGRLTLALITATATNSQNGQDDGQEWRPTGLMEKVSRLLEGSPTPLSFNAINASVRGRESYVRQAVEHLIGSGHVHRETAGQGYRHTSLKPYREPTVAPSPTVSRPSPGDSAGTVSPSPLPLGGDGDGDTPGDRNRRPSSRHWQTRLEEAGSPPAEVAP